jgi:hypothetical protein
MTRSTPTPPPSRDERHDETLVDWFLTLEPAERLAELESRLEFFAAARRDGEPKLSQNPRAT